MLAIDPEMIFHFRHNLGIGELVRRFDVDRAFRKRLGAAETLLELELRFTWTENQKSNGFRQLTNNLIVVLVKTLAVPFLVFLLASAILLGGIPRMCADFRFQGIGGDATR